MNSCFVAKRLIFFASLVRKIGQSHDMQRGSRGGEEGGEGRGGSDGGRRDSQIGGRGEGEKEINLPACRRRPKEDDGRRGFPLQKRLPSGGKKCRSVEILFFLISSGGIEEKRAPRFTSTQWTKTVQKMHKSMSLIFFLKIYDPTFIAGEERTRKCLNSCFKLFPRHFLPPLPERERERKRGIIYVVGRYRAFS